MKKIFLSLSLFTLLFLNACYTTKIENTNVKPSGAKTEQWRFYALFGAIAYQEDIVACPGQQIASIETKRSGANVLADLVISAITLGIGSLVFNTNTVIIKCGV